MDVEISGAHPHAVLYRTRVSVFRLGLDRQQGVVSWSRSLHGFTDESRVGGISTTAASDGAATVILDVERSRSGEAPGLRSTGTQSFTLEVRSCTGYVSLALTIHFCYRIPF